MLSMQRISCIGSIGRYALLVGFALGLLSGAHTANANEAALWDSLRNGGHFALLRHALAPGTADPAGFAIEDCNTQRNLSDHGRAQARQIGQKFRDNGIQTARVYASQWCRCRDTAELLGLGPVGDRPALNSFYQRWENREPQTRALADWLGRQDLGTVHVLVTHQVNITALTGISPSSGELVIVRAMDNGDLRVVGTIETE
jgi:phosphohistidine phosphatase SixA